ncbi:MAG TPA: hypothetical protein VGB07_36155 [Blastocatellia bacterium]
MRQLKTAPVSATLKGKAPALSLPTNQYQDVLRWRMWDTARYQAGFAMPNGITELFKIQRGQKAFVINNPAAEYVKRRFDTSLDNNNQIPKGKQFVVNSIQVAVVTLGNLHGSNGTGDNVGLAINPGGPGGTNNFGPITTATGLMQAILSTMFIDTEFGETDKRYESGPLSFFPCRYGASGFAAVAAQPPDATNNAGLGGTTTNALSETWVQNGCFREEPLAFDRILESLDTFNIKLSSDVPFVPNQDFQIQVILDGYLQRPI